MARNDNNSLILKLNQHNAEQLRIVLNALPVAISWARLEDARILFTNRKFTQLFGYRLDDLLTVKDWIDSAYPDPEQRALAEASWYTYFGNPTEDEFEVGPVEVDVRCKNGTVKTTVHGGIILPKAGWALATFVDISARKQDELLIRSLAGKDSLTGLANRRSFDAYLSRALAEAMRESKGMHLLLLDLDGFKQVNDTLGHQAGDALLVEVAQRLKTCVRSSDIVSRFGGDEFAVILPNSGNDWVVDQICRKIINAVKVPVALSGSMLKVGVSIGVSCAPGDGVTEESLFAAADEALYRAKRECKGEWKHHGSLSIEPGSKLS